MGWVDKEERKWNKDDLPIRIRRYISKKEQELERTCRTIWTMKNPKGEWFIFGSFCKNYDRLFVTIGVEDPLFGGCFVPPR